MVSRISTAQIAALSLLLLGAGDSSRDDTDKSEETYVLLLTDSDSSQEQLRARYPEIATSWQNLSEFNLLRSGRPIELTRDMLASGRILAKIAGFYGEAEIRRSFDPRFIPVVKSLLLREQDILRTWRRSGSRILFDDGSFVLLRSNSRAQISTLGEKESTSGSQVKILLMEGNIWSRIEGTVHGRFEIETPTASTIIRGTDFRVKVETVDSTRLEVLDGTVELRVGDQSVSVPAQRGVFSRSGEALGDLRVLPPAPAELWAPQPKQVFRTSTFDHEFRWSPVTEAQDYRLEIARDATFFDVVLETRTGPEPTARVTVLEPGTYFWRVSALSADGFEGTPSADSYFVFVETQP